MMVTAKTIASAAATLRVRVVRLAAAVTCAGIATAAVGCGSSPTGTSPPQRTATGFLAAYAKPDGQVVRPDQGGDTASEGQAYGMLLAEPAGNHAAFARMRWALLRPADRAQVLVLRPDGTVLNPAHAALPMVASAAAAKAAGDDTAARKLLQGATAQQQSHPTYYSGAWDALGLALLTTSPLSTC
jgi:endoglucanase